MRAFGRRGFGPRAFGLGGIAGRLFLAFAGVAALSIAAGGIGWMVLSNVEQAQTTIVARAMPAGVAARAVAETAAQIIARAPLLTGADDQGARASEASALFAAVERLEAQLTEIEATGQSSAAAEELSGVAEELAANLRRQNRLVASRIALTGELAARIPRALQSTDELTGLAETLVSNAASQTMVIISNTYETVEDPARLEETLEALDRLVEVDLFTMERMFELRTRVSEVGLLLNQLARAGTGEEIDGIEARVRDNLRVLARRVDGIDDPVRRRQGTLWLAALEREVEGDRVSGPAVRSGSLFEQRRKVLSLGEELAGLGGDNRALSEAMTARVETLVADAQALAEGAAQAAGRAVDAGRITLLLQSMIFLLVAGFIAWGYVRGNVIRRLTALHHAMRRLAEGDLDTAIPAGGRDELSEMAGTVQVFRDQARAKRELEKVRDRNEAELRRHKEQLEQLVAERTAQLTEANEKLVEEVRNHDLARARAERASRAKTEFLAAMSHEIRTPMNGMLGMLRLMAESGLSRAQAGQLKVVRASGRILLGILNDILDYSKVESGEIQVECGVFDLTQLTEDICALMQGRAREKGLRLGCESGPDVPRAVLGDQRKLSQVLLNLLGNAVKFTDRGEVSLALARGAGDRLRFEVRDSGPGIAEADRAQLFQPFYQAPSSHSRRHGGTGLGLAICQRLVRAMGGEIGCETVTGRGSLFWVELPLPESDLPLPEPESADLSGMARGQTPLKVLVVEDNAVNAMVVEGFLERMGHESRTAESAEVGLALLESEPFDLVLMDISLPGIDGVEATRRLRADPDPALAKLPVIAMSAHVFDSEVAEHMEAGMDAFLGKPVSPERLAEVMAAVMAGRAAPPPEPEREESLAEPAGLPLIDPDVIAGDLAVLGGERTARIVKAFRAAAPPQTERLRSALAAGEREAAASAAHALKGAAAGVGLVRLAALCRRLEAEPFGDPAALDALLAESLEALEALWRELAPSEAVGGE